jgi:hypothetical protein
MLGVSGVLIQAGSAGLDGLVTQTPIQRPSAGSPALFGGPLSQLSALRGPRGAPARAVDISCLEPPFDQCCLPITAWGAGSPCLRRRNLAGGLESGSGSCL